MTTSDDPQRTTVLGTRHAHEAGGNRPAGDSLTEDLLSRSVWSDADVDRSSMRSTDTYLTSVGGGLGSFALADTLRIAGVSADQISVIGDGAAPARTYRYLAANSQIPDFERLRSDAGSTMDNIWGFPSYAWREAAGERSVRPLLNVATEPFGADYYTPRAGQVYNSVDREADRIGWSRMLRKARVRLIRRRAGGGYFTVLTPLDGADPGGPPIREVVRSRFVHVAVGYPGVKFLPDLQAYREQHGDASRVVNAYEPHDHVYEECRRRPSVVLVRGSGIVASRILQRLLDDREQQGAQTTVVHLFRNYVSEPQGSSPRFRRPGRNGWAYQGFNFPKAAWGGQLKDQLEQLDGQGRADLIRQMGGTNTPPRRSWREQLERGRRGGWYREYVGTVRSVDPGAEQSIVTTVAAGDGSLLTLPANFIIDATGLDADISENRLLADLLEHGGAQRSPYGRLDVSRAFEVLGTRSDPGRLYASGSITLGGYYAGVDSFLGLQYAALAIADDLAAQGAVPRIGLRRSVGEWWRWVGNRPPKEVVAR